VIGQARRLSEGSTFVHGFAANRRRPRDLSWWGGGTLCATLCCDNSGEMALGGTKDTRNLTVLCK